VSCSNELLCATWADSHNRSRLRTAGGLYGGRPATSS